MEWLLPERNATFSGAMRRHRAELVTRVATGIEARDSSPPEVPGYRMICIRGAGAAGEVWEAENEDGLAVALKLFHARSGSFEPTGVRELQASRRLDHPGLVRVLDAGKTEEGQGFLVMRLHRGEDLAELIAREGALPWSRVRPLLVQLCDALSHAHRQGIVHRDLKPTNIVIEPAQPGRPTTNDETERCVVVDLGLSRVLGDSVVNTLDGTLVGTPAYMSPEQIRGGTVTHRADVYALGCIAYEMLSGHRPFGGATSGECAVQHLTAPPPRLRVPGLGRRRRALDAVIRRALAKNPARRFPDMAAFADALEAADASDDRWLGPWRAIGLTSACIGVAGLLVALGWTPPELGPEPHASLAVAPVAVEGGTRVVDVSLGLSHTCAVSDGGLAQCWGIDTVGRLGRGTEGRNIGDNEAPADLQPLGLRNVVRIIAAPNARHVCAIDTSAQIRCWGDGVHGALGRGSTAAFGDQRGERLVDLPALRLPGDVVDAALSTARTCAIVQEGRRRNLYCWGRGESGALGLGSSDDIAADVGLENLGPVALGADVLGVAMGNNHTCARLAGGAVRCWGSDALGQLGLLGWSSNIGDGLGDGSGRGLWPNDSNLDVEGLEGVTVERIDASGDRTCILTGEGGVRCWGSNQGAALGYRWDELPGCRFGDEPAQCNLEAPLPFDIDLGDLDGARLVGLSAGQRHTCVVDDLGRGRCFGEGLAGRLGDGGSENIGHWRTPAEAWRGREVGGIVDVGDADGDGTIDPVARVVGGMLHSCAITSTGALRCWGSGGEGRLGYVSTDHVGLGLIPGDDYAQTGEYNVRVFGHG